ncbi:MAG: hypothetical protein VW891_10945, partial [Novosphingobium sp.]
MNSGRFAAKGAISLRRLCAGEFADRRLARFRISMKIELLLAIPGVPRDNLRPPDRDEIRQLCAAFDEQGLE